MIENSDVDERERFAQTARNKFVRLRRRRFATRVTVREYDGRAVVGQALLNHLTRMH